MTADDYNELMPILLQLKTELAIDPYAKRLHLARRELELLLDAATQAEYTFRESQCKTERWNR